MLRKQLFNSRDLSVMMPPIAYQFALHDKRTAPARRQQMGMNFLYHKLGVAPRSH